MSHPITPSLTHFIEDGERPAPIHLGTRYDAAGRFLPEPGNTVVCHTRPDSASERAIVAIRERMMAMPDADRLAFTPIGSLHMTLFQGIVDTRRRLPYWPEDLALDTQVDAMTGIFLQRLAGFESPGPFRIRTTEILPTGLTVIGATDEDVRHMAAWRDALADCLGYRHPDHASYVFHITLAYPVRWLAPERAAAWQQLFDEALLTLLQEAPIVELQPPAFCSFADMNHFEELRVFA